jgi:hypothetical protein
MNIPNSEGIEVSGRARAWKRPERLTTTVINEEDEELESRDEERPRDPGTEEANVGFYQNQVNQNDVAELRDQLNGDISELNSKLTRVENQLAVLIRLMQNPNKPELQARHSQSFPTPTTSSRSVSPDSRKDASAIRNVRQDSENNSSPSWLSPPPIRSNRSFSEPNYEKPSSKRDRNDESPAVSLARHGRRKISDA